MNTRTLLTITSCLAMIAIAAMIYVTRFRHATQPPLAGPHRHLPSAPPEQAPRALTERLASPEVVAPSPTDVLAEYWGEEWPHIQQKAQEDDTDLTLLQATDIPRWQDISDTARKQLHETSRQVETIETKHKWEEADSVEALRERGFTVNRTLTAIDLVEIDRLARTWDPTLHGALELYRDEWDDVLDDLWDRGQYKKAPFYLPPSDPEDAVPTYSSGAFSVGVWVVAYRVRSSDYPGIARMREEIASIARERDQHVQDYLNSL